ncbi:MAG: hypothetical protein HYX28_04185 [Candidatus Koribacter versatilis]|uniref:Uncharacterized protein n=1 Tax=Candidatus Korobacter versatilis TaxID=658062 RepID=A0A932A763_9BACT|nr:hypothetical protein [Candidatus Koribacter versatilis]
MDKPDAVRAEAKAAQRRAVEARLRWCALALAAAGIAALFLHVFGWLRMPFFLAVCGVPSVLLLCALAAYARRIDADLFLNSLWVGILGGVVATVAYDGTRALVERSHIFGYDWTVPILMFGNWITGAPTSSALAKFAGWTYHYWNGVSFGVMYALAFGRIRWYWGIAFGMFLEACMLGLFPMFLRVSNKFDFILISMIGHVAYGAALGVVVEKYALPSERVALWATKD